MEWPSVSIVVISYNEEKNIADCLESLSKLDYPKERYEVIVADSSLDRTPEIVRNYPEVSLLRLSDRNFSFLRNAGIRKAKGEIIAFTDADCIVPKDWLKKLVGSFEKGVAGVGGSAFPPSNASYFGKWVACLGLPAGGAIGLDAIVKRLDRGIDFLSTANALFKKDVLLEVGGFDELFQFGGEDTDISQRIRDKNHYLLYQPDSFVFHKTRDNMSDFIKWIFRRGRARGLLKRTGLLRLFFDPFSPLWLLAGPVIIGMVNLAWIPILLGISWLLLLVVMFTATHKFRLLVARRRERQISLLSIICIVAGLFYLRKLVMNCGQIWERLHGTQRSPCQ